MNRIILLLFVALVTFVLVMIAVNPSFISDTWLYIVGFAGLIGKGVKSFFEQLKTNLVPAAANGGAGTTTSPSKNENQKFTDIDSNSNASANTTNGNSFNPTTVNTSSPNANTNMPEPEVPTAPATLPPPLAATHPPQPSADLFEGTTLRLLRYMDDGQTTLGLLFVNNKYFCMTLEDTFRKDKIRGETRIPKGTYPIKFRVSEVSTKTLSYRKRFPGWFRYHLELQNVPNFQYIYIHSGGNYKHTEGCLLVSDSITFANAGIPTFINSANTFKRLYEFISNELNNNRNVRVIIQDEAWLGDVGIA